MRLFAIIAILGLLVGARYLVDDLLASDPPAATSSGAPNARPKPQAPVPEDALTGSAQAFDAEQLSFVEMGSALGFDDMADLNALNPLASFTGGVSVGDFDGDGRADVFITRVGAPNRLYRATSDGRFADMSEVAGIPQQGIDRSSGSAASVWADIDGDGDLDLFVGGVGSEPDRLYVNNGDGTFTDESQQRGLAGSDTTQGDGRSEGHATMGAAFADWDRDGDLDLITTHWSPPTWGLSAADDVAAFDSICDVPKSRDGTPTSGDDGSGTPRSRMYLNDGSGHFEDVTSKTGVDLSEVSAFTPVFADYNGDAWPDLFVTGDYCGSRLYKNTRDGGFSDVTQDVGLGTDENGMGSVVEDFNGDGILDWFISSIASGPDGIGCVEDLLTVGCSGNRLYLGLENGEFADATDEFGVRESGWAWGAAAEDFDNDGYRDLVVANGHTEITAEGTDAPGVRPDIEKAMEFHSQGLPHIWRGSKGGPWVEGAASVGLEDERVAKALVPFDMDGDGDLDLIVAHTEGPPAVFRNDLSDGGHWLGVKLIDETTSNSNAVGASVRVAGFADERQWVGEVRAGSGYQSSGPGSLHIGLGDRDNVDEIEVRWPNSDQYELYEIADIDATVVIERASR